MDDVGRVIETMAKNNGRSLPQELDFILRPLLMEPQHILVGMPPGGLSPSEAKRSRFPSISEQEEVRAKGLRFEWNEKASRYDAVKNGEKSKKRKARR